MYEYQNLHQHRLIRGLRLLPSWTESAPLIIEFEELALDEPLRFEALSYAWGGQALDRSVICNGQEIPIAATCEAALRRLRHKTRVRRLWIDQICIDQMSVEEKNQQVALMGEVYSKAWRVIVWLGGSVASEMLVQYVGFQRFVTACQRVPGLGSMRMEHAVRKKLDKRLQGACLCLCGFKSLRRLLDKANMWLPNLDPISWFERMWTVQEVALARRAQVLTSRRTMNYDNFMDQLNEWLQWRSLIDSSGKLVLEIDPSLDLLNARHTIRQHILHMRQKGNLKDWDAVRFLLDITAASASVASDKVFAVHGIMLELGFPLPSPDYRLQSGEVYWQAFVAIMKLKPTLKHLELVNGLYWNSRFPSWVPDLSRTWERWRMDFSWLSATKRSKASFELISNDRVIATKGKIVDGIKGRIYQSIDNFIEKDSPEEILRKSINTIHVFQSWIRAALDLRSYPVIHGVDDNDNEFIDPIAIVISQISGAQYARCTPKALTQLKLTQTLWLSIEGPSHMSNLYESIMDPAIQVPLREIPWFANLSHLPEVQLLLLLELLDLTEAYGEAWTRAIGNAFVWTREGRVGTAPLSVREDDVVALIPGVRAPMVLRPAQGDTFHFHGDAYQIIGPAYIHGMMYGETWDSVRPQREYPQRRSEDDEYEDLPEIWLI
jgi:hypothetical protein